MRRPSNFTPQRMDAISARFFFGGSQSSGDRTFIKLQNGEQVRGDFLARLWRPGAKHSSGACTVLVLRRARPSPLSAKTVFSWLCADLGDLGRRVPERGYCAGLVRQHAPKVLGHAQLPGGVCAKCDGVGRLLNLQGQLPASVTYLRHGRSGAGICRVRSLSLS